MVVKNKNLSRLCLFETSKKEKNHFRYFNEVIIYFAHWAI